MSTISKIRNLECDIKEDGSDSLYKIPETGIIADSKYLVQLIMKLIQHMQIQEMLQKISKIAFISQFSTCSYWFQNIGVFSFYNQVR